MVFEKTNTTKDFSKATRFNNIYGPEKKIKETKKIKEVQILETS